MAPAYIAKQHSPSPIFRSLLLSIRDSGVTYEPAVFTASWFATLQLLLDRNHNRLRRVRKQFPNPTTENASYQKLVKSRHNRSASGASRGSSLCTYEVSSKK